MPSSTGLMNSRGIAPPTISFSNTKPSPGLRGARRIFDVAVLAAAAGLADVAALALRRPA